MSSKPVVVKASTTDEKFVKKYPGTIKKADFAKAIGGHLRKLSRCYERERFKGSTYSGRIKVRLVITAKGELKTLTFTVNKLGQTIGACVRKVLKKITYPPSQGGDAEIIYPFIFSANSETEQVR